MYHDEPLVSVRSESCCPRDSGAAGSTPAARFGGPCTAFQQVLRSAVFPPRNAARRTSDVLSCLRRERSGRAPRSLDSDDSEPIFVAPRERSRRGNRLRTSFTLSRLPPRPTNRPKRVALDRSSRTIARATQEEVLQRFTDPRALLRASCPRLSRESRAARSRSLRRPHRPPSLAKTNDDDAHAPVRCDHEARASCS
jgi:hypothetical protein